MAAPQVLPASGASPVVPMPSTRVAPALSIAATRQRMTAWHRPRHAADPSFQVFYPLRFKVLLSVTASASTAWILIYLLGLRPLTYSEETAACDTQAADNGPAGISERLFIYFMWFVAGRTLMFLPYTGKRIALVQMRTHGLCWTYFVHLFIRDGPLYIFVFGSLLFCYHLVQMTACQEDNPELYQALRLFALYSCVLSLICLLLARWHNSLLERALERLSDSAAVSRGSPELIHKLQTLKYDANTFGDEEGKLHPSECAICLSAWTTTDIIKETPCKHVFHEDCIKKWLETARTCALCRQDLGGEAWRGQDGGQPIGAGSDGRMTVESIESGESAGRPTN